MNTTMRNKIYIGVSIIVVLSLVIILLINHTDPQPLMKSSYKRGIFKEFIKFFIQFVFIVLGGGILVQEYNRGRQKKAELKSFRKEIYKSLVEVYLKTKRIRWVLRANCKNSEVNYQLYKEEMAKIIDIKSSLEIIIHEIDSYSKPLINIKQDLDQNLKKMEDYLRELLKEFHGSPQVADSSGKINTITLPYYSQFINSIPNDPNANNSGSDFSSRYRTHFYSSLNLLKENELKMIIPVTQKYLN